MTGNVLQLRPLFIRPRYCAPNETIEMSGTYGIMATLRPSTMDFSHN